VIALGADGDAMLISVATATYFYLPFEEALEIIAKAGFQFIELDLFWERKTWAMAQHLRGIAPRDVIRAIHQAGLKVSSIHDGGGVLEDSNTTRGFINPSLADTLDALGYAPDCLVFHTPHIEDDLDLAWWRAFSGRVIAALEPFRAACQALTIENMPFFNGYTVPLTTPEELLAFVREANLGVTLDTTHYAYMGVDIARAARTLVGKVKTIHLSDYAADKYHVFIGDGELDFPEFLRALDGSVLRWITLECEPAHLGENKLDLPPSALVERLIEAKHRAEQWAASGV
jgi:sugar phosphate isomerase/epimerase